MENCIHTNAGFSFAFFAGNKWMNKGMESIAFCCISTGAFLFPNQRAAKIAVNTVRDYRKNANSGIEVIFNVWKDIECEICRKLLGKDREVENGFE